MADYASISDLNETLVRKALAGSLFVGPFDTAAAVTTTDLFGADHTLAALPAGYTDAGLTTDEGIRFARSQESEQITAWQRLEPVREDPTSDSETLQVDFLETNKASIELFTGADLSAVTYDNGALSIQKPELPTARYFRLLALAVDNIDGDEFYVARFYPRCKVTGWADQAFAKGGGLQWGMTFTAYVDNALGYSKDDMLGGPGFAAVAEEMGLDAVPPPV